jgi:hypothetical protein
VSVLAGGSWRYLSTEDGLIWNDTDGEAFWADPDGSVWIGTSGGLAHYRPPSGGSPGPPVADPVITRLEMDQKSRVVRAEFSSLSYKSEQLVRFAYRLDGNIGPTPRSGSSPSPGLARAGTGWRSGRGFAMGRSRRKWRWRSSRSSRSGGKPGGCGSFCCLAPPPCGASFCGGTGCCAAGTASWKAVRQRTAELESERTKVMEEKRRADEASEAKGRFLATMSHEIRTPLNGVIGLSRLLETMPVPAEALEMVRMIRSSGDALLRVINDVLDFSKVEAGKLELEVAPFHLASFPGRKHRAVSRRGRGKGTAPGCDLAPELPVWVAGDETRLRQVVLNLISNALKFTSPARWCFGRRGTAGRDIASHRDRGSRHRHWDCAGPTASPVLIVQSGGRLHQPSLRGNRPGSGDLETAGRVDGRNHRRGIHAGRGHAVPIHGPDGPCAGTPARAAPLRPRRARAAI